ncbi:uncharacterized protein LOC142579814 isoform X3 [Dermacentor variabilis]|uniref:uncharacterized protein LOC142579814 isoform X3 n=1 Tax=Dermacentor variabilis TaxID=34621 RepID=UPI003F5B4491
MFEQLFTPPEKRPKVESYVEKTVAAYSDKEFRRNFRLSRSAADSLAAEFAKSPHYPSRTDRGGLPPKSPQEHVLSFSWSLLFCMRRTQGLNLPTCECISGEKYCMAVPKVPDEHM